MNYIVDTINTARNDTKVATYRIKNNLTSDNLQELGYFSLTMLAHGNYTPFL